MEEKENVIEEKELENNKLEAEQKIEEKPKKKKRKIGRIISDILFGILVVIILLEAIIGIINMKRLNDGEQPIWYISTKKEETENKTVEEYNLGLYRIIKTDTEKDSRIVLKPFFIQD